MKLPETGRVVIVDDEPKEAMPLIKALSKINIPSRYFTGLRSELPERRVDNIRLFFLDLQLVTASGAIAKVGAVASVLKRLISKDNGPYVLVLWTLHEDYIAELERLFNSGLSSIKPTKTLNLNKASVFKRGHEGEWEIRKNGILTIERRIKSELKKIGAFYIFLLWENMVNRASNKIVGDFSALQNGPPDWNNRMLDMFLKLGESYAGKQLDKTKAPNVIKSALLSFNSLFSDILEEETSKLEYDAKFGISFCGRTPIMNPGVIGEINSRLHTSKATENCVLPGSVFSLEDLNYIHEDSKELKKSILTDLVYKEKINEVKEKMKLIGLEITPICDYAQTKYRVHRMIVGIMYETDTNPSAIFKPSDHAYPTPLIMINGKTYCMAFDLSRFFSVGKKSMECKESFLKLRREICVDIQSKLGSHVIRPGITKVDFK
jgi:hypothetical protein